MDVAEIREQIPVCKNTNYLNTGWSGPSPRIVVDAIKARLDYEMMEGPASPDASSSGREIQNKTKEDVANLLNVSAEEICLTKNTTDGLNIVLNGLHWLPGDEIITCSLEHSSVLVPAFYKQRQYGADLKIIQLSSDERNEIILDKIESAITSRTKLIFLSHIQYSSGLKMPVEAIRKISKDRDIFLLLDGAQAAGNITVDLKAIDCDFYSIPGQKWLLGSEGIGALYIKEHLISQIETTQVSGRAVLEYDNPGDLKPNTDSIDKFLLASTSRALQCGLSQAISFITDIGIDQIQQRNLGLASLLKIRLNEIQGVNVLSSLDENQSSGLVCFDVTGIDSESLVSNLWDTERIVVRRIGHPAGVRASVHFFNTTDEVNHLVKAVRSIALNI